MKPSLWNLLAFTAAFLALGLVLLKLADPPPGPPPNTTNLRGVASQEQLDVLRRRVENLESARVQPVAATVEREAVLPDLQELEARLAAVERAIGRGPQKPSDAVPAERPPNADEHADTPRSRWDAPRVTDVQESARLRAIGERVILDPRAGDLEKVRAHGELRYVGGAYSAAAMGELLRLGREANPGLRADVWRFFDGVDCPATLVAPLLVALHDPAPGVREEVAETLANHLDAPGVRDALAAIAASDASESVRAKATRSLAHFSSRRAASRTPEAPR